MPLKKEPRRDRSPKPLHPRAYAARARSSPLRTSLRIDARDFLWNRLQGRQLGGFRFHRDLKIPPHEVDFLCIGRKLVVEVAGEAAVDQDRERSLAEAGYRIVRFREQDVIGRIESVLKVILKVLAERGRR